MSTEIDHSPILPSLEAHIVALRDLAARIPEPSSATEREMENFFLAIGNRCYNAMQHIHDSASERNRTKRPAIETTKPRKASIDDLLI